MVMNPVNFNQNARQVREIVLDLKTTQPDSNGLSQIIEVAALKMCGHRVTGLEFHCSVNSDQPMNATILEHLRCFIGQDRVVINADGKAGISDILNNTFAGVSIALIPDSQWFNVFSLVKKIFADQKVSLQTIAQHYSVPLPEEKTSPTLRDARLLAQIYHRLTRDGADFKTESLKKIIAVPSAKA